MLPESLEIIVGILSIPATLVGLFYSYVLIKKTLLEAQKTKLEILEKEKKLRIRKKALNSADEKTKGNNFLDKIIVFLLSPFLSIEESEDTQKISKKLFGAIFEFFFLCIFLFSTLSLFSQYYAITFPKYSVPPIFQGIIFPLLVSTVGIFIYLSIFLFDILEMSNVFGRDIKKIKERKIYTFLVIFIAVISALLTFAVSLHRLALTSLSGDILTLAMTISSIAMNLIVIPTLLCTALSFRSVIALLVVPTLVIYIIKIALVGVGKLFRVKV